MTRSETSEMDIASRDYWFKVVDFLQQNWALIEQSQSGVTIHFIDDGSRVFDELQYPSHQHAEAALQRNGFRRYADDDEAQQFIVPPSPPFARRLHSIRAIYSSGRFWQ